MSENDPAEGRKRAVRAQILKGGAALAALIIIMLWLSGAFVRKVEPGAAGSKSAGSRAKPAVSTAGVERKTFPLIVEQVGTIRSRSEAKVCSHLMAQIREIRVKPGDLVQGPESGASPTVLATLDDRAVKAKLHQARSRVAALGDAILAAKANMQKADSDFRRYDNLLKNGATTAQRAQYARAQRDVAAAEVARLQSQKKQSEAALKEARVMLSYTVIDAPFSGRVVEKLLDVGDMAAPGRPLFFLDSPSQAEVHAVVSESILHYLKVGSAIEVVIDALHRRVTGKIREIVPSADTSTRTVVVKITMPASADLVNGLFARIEVACGSYHALVIPAAAVGEIGELYFAETVDAKGRVERRFIRPGKTRGSLIEVLSGLKAGEEVAVP